MIEKLESNTPSDAATCSAIDCSEWLKVFRMRYERATEAGHIETIEALEYLFDALWDGYGGECGRRWCDLLGAPREDGRKVLNQEPPYENLWDWLHSRNAKCAATGSERNAHE